MTAAPRGLEQALTLLRTYSSTAPQDEETFDALALNWLIAGTDAHAKDFSILISVGAQVRLAPLYDIASILPYAQLDLSRAKLAMKIATMARAIPDLVVDIARQTRAEGLEHPVMDRLMKRLLATAALRPQTGKRRDGAARIEGGASRRVIRDRCFLHAERRRCEA